VLVKRYIYSVAVGCGSLSSVIDGHSVVWEWERGFYTSRSTSRPRGRWGKKPNLKRWEGGKI